MLLRGRNQGARRERPARVRLEVEQLETRLAPAVLTPLQVRNAYGFDEIQFNVNGKTIVGDGAGQTIAIVNAYDNTKIFSDTDYFNRTFGITAGKTLYQQYGAASTWLTKVNPQGTPPPDPTGGLWHLETALDVQWAHAIAPAAKILLVQAKSGTYADLLSAVDYARAQPGVVVVSMSWGSVEWPGENAYDWHFTTPAGHLGGSNGQGGAKLPGGVTFVAAAGDNGAPGGWPAMSPFVLSVGGTKLDVDAAGNYKSEVAWTKSGGGTSLYESRPGYQSSVNSGGKRTIPDVAYNGDPASGVYVYSTMPLKGKAGAWWSVGGTSAGAPQWAALVAVANQGRALMGLGSLDGASQTLPAIYNMDGSNFHDVTKGSNGNAAKTGYDLVTGRGTPYANRVVNSLLRADTQGKLTLPQKVTVPSAQTARPLAYFFAVDVAVSSERSVTFVLAVDASARANDAPTGVAQPSVARRSITALADVDVTEQRLGEFSRADLPRHIIPVAAPLEALGVEEIDEEAPPAPAVPPLPLEEAIIDYERERVVAPLLDACYTEPAWLNPPAAEVTLDPFCEENLEWAGSVAVAVLASGAWGALILDERRRERRQEHTSSDLPRRG